MAGPEAGSPPAVTLEVFRYLPETDAQPRFQRYEVPFRPDWVVLDALNYIKDHLDGTLSYRWSCRMGICGSCGMMVNGEPKLTCAAFLRDYFPRPVRVEPLAHFPVIRDLVINLDDFMAKLREVKAWLIPRAKREAEPKEYLQTPAELARYKQYSLCINCMLCYAACPVYGLEPHFVGPAAIALAQRFNLDSRDSGRGERTPILSREEAVWECTFVGECSVVCPKSVDPAAAIQQAKLSNALAWYQAVLMPVERPAMTEYRRPLAWNWWLAKPAYIRFMVRELTALFVGGYALFLLLLLYRAHQGTTALAAFLEGLQSPFAVALHLFALAMALYHTVTWFQSTPKSVLFPGGEKRGREGALIALQYAIWLVLSIAVVMAVLTGARP